MLKFSFLRFFVESQLYFFCFLFFYETFYFDVKIIEQMVATKRLQYHFSLPFFMINLIDFINPIDSVISNNTDVPLQEHRKIRLLYFLYK